MSHLILQPLVDLLLSFLQLLEVLPQVPARLDELAGMLLHVEVRRGQRAVEVAQVHLQPRDGQPG